MDELVYPRERTLGTLTLVLGLLIWLALIVGTFGGALVLLLFGFFAYLFAQSALIAHIKGNGVELSETQFPDLHTHFTACCERLSIARRPKAYIINGNGTLNAFATQFLGLQYVVLLSDVIDAMDRHAEGVRFYMGHELGHLRLRHISGHLFRWPALWLPLVGAAYSRAKESSCDRHGLACCSSPASAAHALAALSSGGKRWAKLDPAAYLRQAEDSRGFWMSFHELTAGYPWLTKRFARLMQTRTKPLGRNGFAYALATFVPYTGRLSPGLGMLVAVYVIGVLAAVAIPAYQTYQTMGFMQNVINETRPVRASLALHQSPRGMTGSLDQLGLPSVLPDGSSMRWFPGPQRLFVHTRYGDLIFNAQTDIDGQIVWTCTNGAGLQPARVPKTCQHLN